MIKEYNITDAVFLLMITISGSIIFGSLDQDKQHFFVENLLFKNILVLSLIFFLSNSLVTSTHNPLNELKNSFFIWILFIIFIKLDKWFIVTGILMLVIYYILSTAIDFQDTEHEQEQQDLKQEHEQKNQEDEKEYVRDRDVLIKTQQFIVYSMAGIVGVGYVVHLRSLYEKGNIEWSDIF